MMSSTPPASRQLETPGEGGSRTGYLGPLGDILTKARMHIWSASKTEKESIAYSPETGNRGERELDFHFICARERLITSAGTVELWTCTGQRFLFLGERPSTNIIFWGAGSQPTRCSSGDKEELLLLLLNQQVQDQPIPAKEGRAKRAKLGRTSTTEELVERYVRTIRRPRLQITLATRMQFTTIWPIRSTH